MPKYLIERDLPGAGAMTDEDIRMLTETSCGVLEALGRGIQWVQSYVSDDKITCVYIADNEHLVREHARRGRFPVDRVLMVRRVIDPTSAETPMPMSMPVPLLDC